MCAQYKTSTQFNQPQSGPCAFGGREPGVSAPSSELRWLIAGAAPVLADACRSEAPRAAPAGCIRRQCLSAASRPPHAAPSDRTHCQNMRMRSRRRRDHAPSAQVCWRRHRKHQCNHRHVEMLFSEAIVTFVARQATEGFITVMGDAMGICRHMHAEDCLCGAIGACDRHGGTHVRCNHVAGETWFRPAIGEPSSPSRQCLN